MGIGERKLATAVNKGGNARNEMGMQVWGINVGMRRIYVEMQKMWGISLAMQEIKVET